MKKERTRSWSGWMLAAIVATVATTIWMNRPQSAAPREYPVCLPEAVAKTNSACFLVTGYCNCGRCCGWRRKWFLFGEPVYDYGANKGRSKRVGLTAKGTIAAHGTIAADLTMLPFGTRLEIPGYGIGQVEDVGGAIKGRHIDIWFPSHAEARRWGARWLELKRLQDVKYEKK